MVDPKVHMTSKDETPTAEENKASATGISWATSTPNTLGISQRVSTHWCPEKGQEGQHNARSAPSRKKTNVYVVKCPITGVLWNDEHSEQVSKQWAATGATMHGEADLSDISSSPSWQQKFSDFSYKKLEVKGGGGA